MKFVLATTLLAGALTLSMGCEETELPDVAKTLLSSQDLSAAVLGGAGDPQWQRDQLRARDGSCGELGATEREGQRFRGVAGQGNAGGDRLRLRDGSCGN